jgi:hypothetical protein
LLVGETGQWATEILEYSSQYSNSSWSAQQILNEPNTATCGDIATSWATKPPNNGIEFIEIKFAEPVYAHRIEIRETYNPGAVVKIEAKDSDGNLYTLWEGTDDNRQCPGYLIVKFSETDYETNIIRITMDTKLVTGWNEIDAVRLIGRGQLDKPLIENAIIQGRLLFDGKSITDFTNETPRFWFRNESTFKEEQSARANYQDGSFSFYDLPVGKFAVQISINANTENTVMSAGDFYSWKAFEVLEDDNPELIINLKKVIHLIEPQNNNAGLEGWDAECMQKQTFESPVTFRWDSIGDNVIYSYRVWRMNCLNNYNSAGTVAEAEITETGVTLDLPSSLDNECYAFDVDAKKDGQMIGILLTHGIVGGLGWDYRFRVK